MKPQTQTWKHPKDLPGWKTRLLTMRKEPTIVRLSKPTRLTRARSLGYKAKQGFVMVRVKIRRGNRKRPQVAGGRKPKQSGRFYPLSKSLQTLAEQRVAKKYPNTEVLNSYWVGEDGQHKWYECILIDRSHPVMKKDPQTRPLTKHKKRALRGLTSAQKKSRNC